jgi:hypothetical protein
LLTLEPLVWRQPQNSADGARRCASLAWPWTLVLVTAFVRRAFLSKPSRLFWPDCRQPVVHEMRAVAVASWVIYAILGVLVLLIVWRVLREWTHTTEQAANLRTAVFIMGVIIAALVVWHFMPR